MGFPGGSNDKESTCNARDSGSIPGSGRSWEGNGYPLQYSYLENSMDRGAWQAIVPEIAKSQTLLNGSFTFFLIFHMLLLSLSAVRVIHNSTVRVVCRCLFIHLAADALVAFRCWLWQACCSEPARVQPQWIQGNSKQGRSQHHRN